MITIDQSLDYLRPHVARLASELSIIITAVKHSDRGSQFDCATGVVRIDPKQSLDLGELPVQTLAHEMRHAWQIRYGVMGQYLACRRYGLLGPRRYSTTWRGMAVTQVVLTCEEYTQLPWEVDANEFAASYVARLGLANAD